VRRFAVDLPLPELGWNFVSRAEAVLPAAENTAPAPANAGGAAANRGAAVGPAAERGGSVAGGLVEPGWAYFANSYRLGSAPLGFRAWTAVYGESFVAALQGTMPHNAALLLCQFHPELSGPWGLALYRRWLHLDEPGSLAGQKSVTGQNSAAGQNPAARQSSSSERGSAGVMISGTGPGQTVSHNAPKVGAARGAGTALRIVPCLDLKNGRVYKGTRFENLQDLGDPVELAVRYEAEGADELAMLDITATIEGRAASLEVLRRVRARLGIPIVMGGGIRSDEDAAAVIEAGADRVAVNSAAVADPELLDRLAARFGIQCVVLAIDAASSANGSGAGPWRVVVEAGRRATGLEAAAWAAEGARRGAGEILLTSIDRDGTGTGYDLKLIDAVARSSGLPVIASGGAAGGAEGMKHFAEAAVSGARAVLAAGAFHRGELRIDDVKRYLAERRIGVRL
jgi:cyclase